MNYANQAKFLALVGWLSSGPRLERHVMSLDNLGRVLNDAAARRFMVVVVFAYAHADGDIDSLGVRALPLAHYDGRTLGAIVANSAYPGPVQGIALAYFEEEGTSLEDKWAHLHFSKVHLYVGRKAGQAQALVDQELALCLSPDTVDLAA